MVDFSDQLIFSIREKDNERAKSLIENYNLYNSIDSTQATLLHYSAKCGNEDLTKYLLDKGCPVDCQDIVGKTPIVMALRRNHKETIKILLDAGADITALNRNNKSLLHFFADTHNLSVDVIKLLLLELQKRLINDEEMTEKIIDANIDLYKLSMMGNPAIIKNLLKNSSFSSNSREPYCKQSCLHYAVAYGYAEIVQVLLENDAQVNAIDIYGANCLYYIYQGNTEHTPDKVDIVKMLVNSGISLQSCCDRGGFQVINALVRGNHEVIRIILEADIDFTARDTYSGRSILHSLAVNRNPCVIGELKRHIHKFNVNVLDDTNESPLSVAVMFGNVPMVKFLIEQSADPNSAECISGTTPLYFAYAKPPLGYESEYYKQQYYECAEILLQNNADPQAVFTTENGRLVTIFNVVSEANSFDRVRPLIARIAMLDDVGTPISEIIRTSIDSNEMFKTYFNRCRQMLQRNVFGSIKVIELFNNDIKKIGSYINNRAAILKLERLRYKLQAISHYQYYHNSLKKHISKKLYERRFKSTGAKIVGKILKGHFDSVPLVLDNIVAKLDHDKLHRLYKF